MDSSLHLSNIRKLTLDAGFYQAASNGVVIDGQVDWPNMPKYYRSRVTKPQSLEDMLRLPGSWTNKALFLVRDIMDRCLETRCMTFHEADALRRKAHPETIREASNSSPGDGTALMENVVAGGNRSRASGRRNRKRATKGIAKTKKTKPKADKTPEEIQEDDEKVKKRQETAQAQNRYNAVKLEVFEQVQARAVVNHILKFEYPVIEIDTAHGPVKWIDPVSAEGMRLLKAVLQRIFDNPNAEQFFMKWATAAAKEANFKVPSGQQMHQFREVKPWVDGMVRDAVMQLTTSELFRRALGATRETRVITATLPPEVFASPHVADSTWRWMLEDWIRMFKYAGEDAAGNLVLCTDLGELGTLDASRPIVGYTVGQDWTSEAFDPNLVYALELNALTRNQTPRYFNGVNH